jgi:hypothetical protein
VSEALLDDLLADVCAEIGSVFDTAVDAVVADELA